MGNPHSCIFDSELTMAQGKFVKVVGWYDNEWGYSNRCVEMLEMIGKQICLVLVLDARDRSAMKIFFDHEKLDVYREAIAFCGWVASSSTQFRRRAAVKDQLDRASTSIPLNVAEGNGKFRPETGPAFSKSRAGSALECAACLDVMVVRALVAAEDIAERRNGSVGSCRC